MCRAHLHHRTSLFYFRHGLLFLAGAFCFTVPPPDAVRRGAERSRLKSAFSRLSPWANCGTCGRELRARTSENGRLILIGAIMSRLKLIFLAPRVRNVFILVERAKPRGITKWSVLKPNCLATRKTGWSDFKTIFFILRNDRTINQPCQLLSVAVNGISGLR